jgi:hypothetical protein
MLHDLHFSIHTHKHTHTHTHTYIYIYIGKSHPAAGRCGPRGSGVVKAPDFLDVRHYKGGRSSAIGTGRLYPRRNPWYSLSEAESTSGHMVPSGEPRKKSPVTPPGTDPGTVRLVLQCLNHYATPGLHIYICVCMCVFGLSAFFCDSSQ